MVESELNFGVFMVAHFCIHVEYIHIIETRLRQPPLHMINMARMMEKDH
jgi:hypothetical protein